MKVWVCQYHCSCDEYGEVEAVYDNEEKAKQWVMDWKFDNPATMGKPEYKEMEIE